MPENFTNLEKEMDIQVHETHMSPHRFNPKKISLKHFIIKLSKMRDREKFLKAARKKTHFIQGNSHEDIGIVLSGNFAGQEKVG